MGARQRESVFSMKGARIVVLGIVLAVGGTAAYLVRGDDPPPPAPPPVVQVDSDDVLVAGTDIGVGPGRIVTAASNDEFTVAQPLPVF
jgi:Flp pilus assembly protein CpaB